MGGSLPWNAKAEATHTMTKQREADTAVATSTRFVHITNGDCAANVIHAAGIPGASSLCGDVLHEGPVPGDVSEDELAGIRMGFLSEEGDVPDEAREQRHDWRGAIARANAYDELVLWYEHDLFDQLNLIHLLSHLARHRPEGKRVSLICIGSFPGRPHFKGLGELTPAELAPLFDTRAPVGAAEYELANRAWRAFRAPDPREIEALLAGDTSALPYLAAALSRHLEEFPWTIDGLSRTERRLMEMAADGPVDLWTVFPRMHDLETAFYVADLSFWNIVADLASASPPLVTVDIASRPANQLPRGTVRLTEAGRSVLAGDVDRVRRCGLDRWLGGVHLTGSGSMWRWNESGQRIVKA
jgi:hypothetical protein